MPRILAKINQYQLNQANSRKVLDIKVKILNLMRGEISFLKPYRSKDYKTTILRINIIYNQVNS